MWRKVYLSNSVPYTDNMTAAYANRVIARQYIIRSHTFVYSELYALTHNYKIIIIIIIKGEI